MDKKQREERRREEDRALNRGLLWVVGAIVFEGLLVLLNRYYINAYIAEVKTVIAIQSALGVIRVAGVIAGVACIAWAFLWLRRGRASALPVVVALALWAAALCSHVLLAYNKQGIRMLFLLVPALAGLALVYYLYQREFFLSAAASGAAAVGLWFIRYDGLRPEVLLCVALVAAVAALALVLKKGGGSVKLGGQELRVVPKKTSYVVIFASCGVGLAALLAAALLGGSIAYYLVFAMAAWIFALLVYYTVKLM